MNCSRLLQYMTLPQRSECYPFCVCVCLCCRVTVTDPPTTDYSAVRLCPLFPVLIRWLTPGGLTSSRDVFLSSSSPLSSAHSQFFQPSFWRKMNVCWLTRLGVTESALSMAALSVPRPPLLSPSLSAAAHSVCGLREPWSPVTPWISGCAVGGWSLLFR